MTDIKHAPLPWSQYANGDQIYGGDNYFIACVQSKNRDADAAFIVTAVNAYDKHLALIETLTKALEEIRDVQPQEFNAYPADWQEQRDACDDCQRYKDHPLMRGICDTHRKPMYDRESHDTHQIRSLGYRAKSMARDALDTAKQEFGQ